MIYDSAYRGKYFFKASLEVFDFCELNVYVKIISYGAASDKQLSKINI